TPEPLDELAEETPEPLPRPHRGCRGRANASVGRNPRAGDIADAFPVLETPVTVTGQPEHDAAVREHGGRKDAVFQPHLDPVEQLHSGRPRPPTSRPISWAG